VADARDNVTLVLVDAKTAAAMCSVSRSTWLGWDAAGLCPAPVRIGGRVLWCSPTIRRWALAGCPGREDWEAMLKSEGLT